MTRENCAERRAFLQHRGNAIAQGKAFDMEEGEWLWLWLSSGHFDQCGQKPTIT